MYIFLVEFSCTCCVTGNVVVLLIPEFYFHTSMIVSLIVLHSSVYMQHFPNPFSFASDTPQSIRSLCYKQVESLLTNLYIFNQIFTVSPNWLLLYLLEAGQMMVDATLHTPALSFTNPLDVFVGCTSGISELRMAKWRCLKGLKEIHSPEEIWCFNNTFETWIHELTKGRDMRQDMIKKCKLCTSTMLWDSTIS